MAWPYSGLWSGLGLDSLPTIIAALCNGINERRAAVGLSKIAFTTASGTNTDPLASSFNGMDMSGIYTVMGEIGDECWIGTDIWRTDSNSLLSKSAALADIGLLSPLTTRPIHITYLDWYLTVKGLLDRQKRVKCVFPHDDPCSFNYVAIEPGCNGNTATFDLTNFTVVNVGVNTATVGDILSTELLLSGGSGPGILGQDVTFSAGTLSDTDVFIISGGFVVLSASTSGPTSQTTHGYVCTISSTTSPLPAGLMSLNLEGYGDLSSGLTYIE